MVPGFVYGVYSFGMAEPDIKTLSIGRAVPDIDLDGFAVLKSQIDLHSRFDQTKDPELLFAGIVGNQAFGSRTTGQQRNALFLN